MLYLTQNIGLRYTSAANGALVHGGIPVVAALMAVPILGERLDRRRLGGTLVSVAGVAAVVLFGRVAGVGLPALGDVLLLLSTVAFSAYLVLGRRAFPDAGALPLVAGVTCYGLLYLLPASAVELAVRGMVRPTATDILGLLYLGGVWLVTRQARPAPPMPDAIDAPDRNGPEVAAASSVLWTSQKVPA
ncbi:MAG TPA: DMT family transporter [Thermomicrobiales bacterium]